MPARPPDRGPLRVPGGRPPQHRAASSCSGSASRRSLRACSPAGVRIMRRIPVSRSSERFVGMRTAGTGSVRGRAVGADGIPIWFGRRSGAVRERDSGCGLAGDPPAGALPAWRRCGWESPPIGRYRAPRSGSRLAIRLLLEQPRAVKVDSGCEACLKRKGVRRSRTPEVLALCALARRRVKV